MCIILEETLEHMLVEGNSIVQENMERSSTNHGNSKEETLLTLMSILVLYLSVSTNNY